MLQQVKQIEDFFRNEVNEEQPRPLVPSYDTKESPPDVHSSKEVENLLKEISLLQQELKGLLAICHTHLILY